jgi:hypothetical protein
LHVLCALFAFVMSILPFLGSHLGFIGYTCGIKEGGPGITAGKALLLLTYYLPYWGILFFSQVLNFALRLVKADSYAATANGPHHVEVTIRRLTWYPLTFATAFLVPSAHAYFMHQHNFLSPDAEVWFAATWHMWGLHLASVVVALGVLLVEVFVGKRDRNIVRGDPLVNKPVNKQDQNLEIVPHPIRATLMRDRFWMLMNAVEERKLYLALRASHTFNPGVDMLPRGEQQTMNVAKNADTRRQANAALTK